MMLGEEGENRARRVANAEVSATAGDEHPQDRAMERIGTRLVPIGSITRSGARATKATNKADA